MTTTAAPDAVSFAVSGTAVYGDHITVRIGSTTGLHEIAVHETGSGTPLGAYTVTPSIPATTAVVPLSPMPHSTSLTITITALGSTPGTLDTITFYLPHDTTVPTNIASNVCTGGGYRYGYNGKMKDNEWAGEGNNYDYGARHYDPRIARWSSIDPLSAKYPYLSPYAFTANNPILYKDFDGNDFGVQVNHNDKIRTIVVTATYYATSQKAYDQALKASGELNAVIAKVSVSGEEYTLTFKIKVEKPAESIGAMSSEFLASENSKANSEGNVFHGTVGPSPDNSKGGDTRGNVIRMFSVFCSIVKGDAPATIDMGNSSEAVSHEMIHTMGAVDKQGGRMEYVDCGQEMLPISTGDIQQILNYAIKYDGKVNTDDDRCNASPYKVTVNQSGDGDIKTSKVKVTEVEKSK